ncbi:MAG: N-acetyl-gamma-glutamyl-phosphate reductase [Acidobacteriia bacterium]|nr:N-acetyl-gamma-glutamyl-phosphate reductase [Terriglobia bacterium]
MPAAPQPAVVGATGYAGFELTRLLLRHGRVRKPILLGRDGEAGASLDLSEIYPHVAGNGGYPIQAFSWDRLKDVDVLFLSTPHEVSREWAPEAVARGIRVIDLSGAWRLKNPEHRSVYGFTNGDQRAAQLDASAVYGIPELYADAIPSAPVVANAGCYATSVILALAPWVRAGLLDLDHGIICDSKSGVSGAGKQPTAKTHFVEVADNLSAYSVFGHRHTGEMLEQLGLAAAQFQFTPHLLPIPRGILSTIYVKLARSASADELEKCLRDFYSGKPWVRVFAHSRLPQIKFSLNTNYCDLGFAVAPDGERVVLVSCLDNLMKGAAGQAVQNMNVMFGFDEREGLQ